VNYYQVLRAVRDRLNRASKNVEGSIECLSKKTQVSQDPRPDPYHYVPARREDERSVEHVVVMLIPQLPAFDLVLVAKPRDFTLCGPTTILNERVSDPASYELNSFWKVGESQWHAALHGH
jgi:hypothetical protein